MNPVLYVQSELQFDDNTRAHFAEMLSRLFDNWQLSKSDQLAMLGLNVESRATLSRYRNGKPLANSRDLLERAAYLLYIHARLRLIFPYQRNLAYGWMTARVDDFSNMTPVEMVKLHGIIGLNMVCTYLDKLCGE